MQISEKISIEYFGDKSFKIRLLESENDLEASFTHYLHNHQNGASQYYKSNAIAYVKNFLDYKFPEVEATNKVAEEALQYLIFQQELVPFPSPKNPDFKFIDLFAGIGGFRLALQNLNGKCVFTSEWDKYSKQTYQANFGEIPFGDITKPLTKSYIPNNFDVQCAGFPCQAFSIAGKRGGFEDARGTLFFDVAEIIKEKKPKAIFLENVKGLRNHDKGKTLATILNVLREYLGYFKFLKTDNLIFANNLTLIDSKLPEILSQIVYEFYSSDKSRMVDLVSNTTAKNPLDFDISNEHQFYEYKIKRFLMDVALGMMPSLVWSGQYDATGGYLIVKENGDILCYHIYNKNEFEYYLFNNTLYPQMFS